MFSIFILLFVSKFLRWMWKKKANLQSKGVDNISGANCIEGWRYKFSSQFSVPIKSIFRFDYGLEQVATFFSIKSRFPLKMCFVKKKWLCLWTYTCLYMICFQIYWDECDKKKPICRARVLIIQVAQIALKVGDINFLCDSPCLSNLSFIMIMASNKLLHSFPLNLVLTCFVRKKWLC